MILDPAHSSDTLETKVADEEQRKKILADTEALRNEIKGWEDVYREKNLKQYWGEIGTDSLYLRDGETVGRAGKYPNTVKKLYEGEKKTIDDARKELKSEPDATKKKAEEKKLDDALKQLNDKRGRLETSVKNLRKSIRKFTAPMRDDAKKSFVDLTAIKPEPTLRDQFRVLQAFNNIGRERLWEQTEFKIKFGGRDAKFTLKKAPLGYFQMFYDNPKEERYGGTQYDKHIFPQINKIKGKDTPETRKKQVKLAEFIRENLDKKISEQPKYEDLINDKEVPLKELEDIKVKRAVEDFVILGNVVEAAAMPQKQLDYWSKKLKADSGVELDTSSDIEDLDVAGARLEDYKSSGRTMGLDTVFYDQLQRFKNGDIKVPGTKESLSQLDEVFSNEEFPARMQGGTSESKRWAAKPKTQARPLLSSLEFGPLAITPGASATSDSKTAKDRLAQDMVGKDIGKKLGTKTMEVDEKTTKAVKRELVNSDGFTVKKKLKTDTDVTDSGGTDCPKRQGVCSFRDKKIEVDEDSVKFKDDILTFDLYDSHNKDKRYTAKTKFDPESLSSVKYGGEQDRYARDSGRSAIHGAVGTAFGVHGTIMSAFGAISSFERGDTEKGVISSIQAAHSFGSLTKLNEMIEKVGEKALLKGVSKGAAKLGLSEIAEKASSKLLKMAERDSERLLGDIPYVGLAFDAYFIAEDITDLTKAVKEKNTEEIALDTVHLILDIETTIANFIVDILGPEFEPIVWALSLLRMSIDDFYYDISDELKKAHGTGEKILAFFKGLGEGFVDFLTGGLLRSLKQLNERKKNDTELLNKFANPRLYFNLSSDCETIDFTDGSFSVYGGGIKFKLNDDDSFTVTISNVPGEGGIYLPETRTFSCPGLKEIILGIGQSQSIKWTTQEAKLWAVIPVASAQVIDDYIDDENSLYGSYTGNKEDNEFIAYQGNFSKVLSHECQDPDATGLVDLRLKNYFYILNGMAGDDTFFLGPQQSHVTGGQGHDLYYLGTHGGKTVIDNFAYDKLSDTLWLNVSHGHVICGRKDYDLLIQYCGTHMALIKNWFYPVISDFRRHLVLLTRDGVQLKIKDLGFHNNKYTVDCVPSSIDLSKSGKEQYLDLSKSPYTEVITVTGSNKSDTIIGNDESNFINAGPGSNIIKGGQGEDTYMVKPKGGCDHIHNYAEDELQDKLFIPINYQDIEITAVDSDLDTTFAKEKHKKTSRKSNKRRQKKRMDRNSKKDKRSSSDIEAQPMDLKIAINPQAELGDNSDCKCIVSFT